MIHFHSNIAYLYIIYIYIYIYILYILFIAYLGVDITLAFLLFFNLFVIQLNLMYFLQSSITKNYQNLMEKHRQSERCVFCKLWLYLCVYMCAVYSVDCGEVYAAIHGHVHEG